MRIEFYLNPVFNSFSHENFDNAQKMSEKELKLKSEEIYRLKNELESLKRHLNEKDRFEKEILNNQQLSSSKKSSSLKMK